MFRSKVARIHNKSFKCCVSTAKEGLFQKQSTIILEPKVGNNAGVRAAELRFCGKVIYSPSLRTVDRLQFHDVISRSLDALGDEDCTLEQALDQIFGDLKRRGVAVETLNLASDQANADAQINLGTFYTHDEGVSQDDFALAAVACRDVAEQGYPKAQLMLGELYASGDGVPQDYAQAASWYRKAAEQGLAPAQYNLGTLYSNGQGVSQDYAQAATWYRKAAWQGDPRAQRDLGVLYGNGQGVPQDYTQSAFWRRKAAEQGNAQAQLDLGQLYEAGQGVPQDYAEACFWSEIATASNLYPPLKELAESNRNKAASHLAPADLSRVQQRVRTWFQALEEQLPNSAALTTSTSESPGARAKAREALSVSEEHKYGELPRLRGVRGWLLLFCVVTTIIAPLAHLADAARTSDAAVFLIDISFTTLAFYTGLSVWRVRRHAFRWVRAYLIVTICLGVVTYVLSLGQANDFAYDPTSATIPEITATRMSTSQTIGSVIAAVIWWQYFKKSKRVNVTFGSNL